MQYILLVRFYSVIFLQVMVESVEWCSLDCASNSGKMEKNTMCLYKHQTSTETCKNITSSLTQKKNKEILHLHNAYRNNMAAGQGGWPAAANMRQLSWDEDLELMALRWAEQCKPTHDNCRRTPEFQNVSQNYGMVANTNVNPEGTKTSFEGWVSGRSKANAAIVSYYKHGDDWGGFTQVIWANTFKLGCAQVRFSEMELGVEWKRTVTICNYGPAGNVVTGRIYEEGKPCTKCPTGTECKLSSPYPNLCASPDYISNEAHLDVMARQASEGSRMAYVKPKQCLACTMMIFLFLAMY